MPRRIRLPIALSVGVLVLAIGVASAIAGRSTTESQPAAHGGSSCYAERETVRDVPQRVVAAWADNDASAFANVFTRDVSFIVADGTYLKSRAELRAYMEKNFAAFPGTRVVARALDVKCINREVGVVITQGGILMAGETEVPSERIGRQTWVVIKDRGDWAVTAYHNARISGD
jgi:uncharacterized protein (TIGR02246 family)